MYNDFFGFSEKPFTVTPNPRFMFLSKNHREVFAHLLYGIKHHAGFIEVTGEIGTGKTTVLRTLLGQLEEEAFRLAFIFNPSLSALELLRSINREFGITASAESRGELLEELNRFLLEENRAGRTVVVVIDEAQNLDPAVLEQIRLLSNLETETDKLIQIVLVGQPELGEILDQPALRQLSQRVTVRYHLRSMDEEDTLSYIRHRLEVAGYRGPDLFTPAALKGLFRHTGGFPRLLNILSDRALVAAYADDARQVDLPQVKTAVREMRRELPRRHPFMGRTGSFAVGLVLLALLWGGFSLLPAPPPQESPIVAETATAPLKGMAGVLSRLQQKGEVEAASSSLSALTTLYGRTAPVSLAGATFEGMAAQAQLLHLESLRLGGGLKAADRLDTPALIDVVLPGEGAHRILALVALDDDEATLRLDSTTEVRVGRKALQQVMTGKMLLIWDNYLELPLLGSLGSKGDEVLKLQQLLHDAGFATFQPNGLYDARTREAVLTFQAKMGLTADGWVGGRTLLLLYQASRRFSPPRLSSSQEAMS
ncbi:MAG: AAA family ATPase [Desulfuromonas sp.]|nr:MAG: AAA family ATPase [Desulfuromonas sp.]